jgi:LysR family transcriptional regulator, regulator for bpeEF and oprC
MARTQKKRIPSIRLMDKLRALRYFVNSAKAGSFTRAAGQLGVTVPAVQKLVGQLERELGVTLLVRSSQGLALTAAGSRYLFDVESMLAELDRVDGKIRPRKGDLSGTVVVASPSYLIEAIFERSFAEFIVRYPEISLEFRTFDANQSHLRAGMDIYLCHGWFAPPDLVKRTLRISSFITVATRAFWDRYGRPTHPNDLRHIPCLTLRSFSGTLMDLWDYEREGEIVRVPVKGPANFENGQRDAYSRLSLRGFGAIRTSDFLARGLLASGELEPVLPDWQISGGPPIQMYYRGDARNDPSVSAVIDFINEQFETANSRQPTLPPRPDWSHLKLPKASLHVLGKGAA